MSSPTFENAKKAYEKAAEKVVDAFEKIKDKEYLLTISQKKIAKAKQLYAFAQEQSQYFDTLVKNRKQGDAAEYVFSVTEVLELATEMLTDLGDGLSKAHNQRDMVTMDPVIKDLEYYDKKLIALVNNTPGKPHFFRAVAKAVIAAVVPATSIFLIALFLSPISPFFLVLVPLIVVFSIAFPHSDTMKRMLDRDFKPQPGSLSEQIDYLRHYYDAEDLEMGVKYRPHGLPGLTAEEMESEYAEEYKYAQIFKQTKSGTEATLKNQEVVKANHSPQEFLLTTIHKILFPANFEEEKFQKMFPDIMIGTWQASTPEDYSTLKSEFSKTPENWSPKKHKLKVQISPYRPMKKEVNPATNEAMLKISFQVLDIASGYVIPVSEKNAPIIRQMIKVNYCNYFADKNGAATNEANVITEELNKIEAALKRFVASNSSN